MLLEKGLPVNHDLLADLFEIGRSGAEDFFDTPEQALGQSIRWQDNRDLKIVAVFENVSNLSSKKFDFLLIVQLSPVESERLGHGFSSVLNRDAIQRWS